MKENKIKFKVEKENTLADILKLRFSKRFYRYLKSSEASIKVNQQQRMLYERVAIGEEIEICYKESSKASSWPKAQTLPEVLFENEHYIIVYKKGGLLTIPTRGNPNSLYQQLIVHLNHSNIHILNRLDKETSGLVVVAKDRYAASLLEPTHQHIIRKYLCLVEGRVEQDGTIQNYLKKDESSNKRLVSEDGQLAISHYRVLQAYENETLLEFVLETGRTHQIRVHTCYMGHPIVGDTLYGGKEYPNLCLTSYYVEFIDPFTKRKICYEVKKGWK